VRILDPHPETRLHFYVNKVGDGCAPYLQLSTYEFDYTTSVWGTETIVGKER